MQLYLQQICICAKWHVCAFKYAAFFFKPFLKTQVKHEENIPAHARGKRNGQYDDLVRILWNEQVNILGNTTCSFSLRMKSEDWTHWLWVAKQIRSFKFTAAGWGIFQLCVEPVFPLSFLLCYINMSPHSKVHCLCSTFTPVELHCRCGSECL